jgi:hypothetical protein
VREGIQSPLDAAPDHATVPVPRHWLQAWALSLETVLVLLDLPPRVAVLASIGILGLSAGIVTCWITP